MLTESGGWRRHLERREHNSSVRVEGAEDSNVTEDSIMQKRKSVKKIPSGRGFRALNYELSQSLVLQGKLHH